VRILASSAQNRTGYIKTSVTSRYLETPLPTMTHNVTKVSTPSPSPLKRDVIYGRLITHAVCPHGCCPLTDWPWRWRQYDPSKRQKYFPKDTA